MRRFATVKIREVLRLKELNVSNVQISRSIKCDQSTLIEVFRRCDELGLDYGQASQMSNMRYTASTINYYYEYYITYYGGKQMDIGNKTKFFVEDLCKDYNQLLHYANFEKLECMLNLLTLRFSSINNRSLNDPFESQRKNIEEHAGNVFISCFCHEQNENIKMWNIYGGSDPSSKVLLRFSNFSADIQNRIKTDFCLIEGKRKMFFNSDEYEKTIKNNSLLGKSIGLPEINTEFDTSNCIEGIYIKEVLYLPHNDSIFTRDYSSKANVVFKTGKSIEATVYDVTPLGQHKESGPTNYWEQEKETRIICRLKQWTGDSSLDFLDIRLEDAFFENLKIVLSPSARSTLKDEIIKQIQMSPLSDKVKKSISVIHSIL